MKLRYISHEEIDRQKYNSCIHYALNGRPWGYKWYLEATARRFDVLVEGENYESVMPLVWEKTWSGRKRIYQPVYTPALGVFSVHVLSQKRMAAFLQEMDNRFDSINSGFTGEPSRNTNAVNWEWTDKRNCYINVDHKNYDQLALSYDRKLMANLEKAYSSDLLTHNNPKPEKVADFMVKHYPDGALKQHPMLRVIYNAKHRGWGWTMAVTDREGNWLASNVFIFSHGRITSIAPCQSPEGKKVGALELLFDSAIRQAAGRPVLLDFASTDNDYYSQYNCNLERYWQVDKTKKAFGLIPY